MKKTCDHCEKYQVLRQPKGDCLACWKQWVEKKPRAAAELILNLRDKIVKRKPRTPTHTQEYDRAEMNDPRTLMNRRRDQGREIGGR
jgi:hypothetical protein